MANLHNYETDHPAEMDYAEHEKTYELMLFLIKWGIIVSVAVLLGMMVGLMGGGGFIGGIGSFIVILGIAYFLT